jgi:hypothetical protein
MKMRHVIEGAALAVLGISIGMFAVVVGSAVFHLVRGLLS